MPFACSVGDSFLKVDFGDRHRYIVITKPNKDSKVVLVNFTKATPYKECVVTFEPKENEELFREATTVPYDYADLFSVSKVNKWGNNDYKRCGAYIVDKIVKGAFLSEFPSQDVLDELKEQYPVEYEKYHPKNIGDD